MNLRMGRDRKGTEWIGMDRTGRDRNGQARLINQTGDSKNARSNQKRIR